jgi:hypothetical protein
MNEDIEVEVRIGNSIFTTRFDNDTPYRDAGLEELGRLRMEALGAAQTISDYIAKMPEAVSPAQSSPCPSADHS